MPKFGKRSKDNLATCHPDLVLLAQDAIKQIDFTVIEGHRGKEAQTIAVTRGTSRTTWPKSKHNKFPSHAFDFIPSPFAGNWNNTKAFKEIGAVLKSCAVARGI